MRVCRKILTMATTAADRNLSPWGVSRRSCCSSGCALFLQVSARGGLSSNLFAMSSRKSSLVSRWSSLSRVRCFVCCFVRVRDNTDNWDLPLHHRALWIPLIYSRYFTSSSFENLIFRYFCYFSSFFLFLSVCLLLFPNFPLYVSFFLFPFCFVVPLSSHRLFTRYSL